MRMRGGVDLLDAVFSAARYPRRGNSCRPILCTLFLEVVRGIDAKLMNEVVEVVARRNDLYGSSAVLLLGEVDHRAFVQQLAITIGKENDDVVRPNLLSFTTAKPNVVLSTAPSG